MASHLGSLWSLWPECVASRGRWLFFISSSLVFGFSIAMICIWKDEWFFSLGVVLWCCAICCSVRYFVVDCLLRVFFLIFCMWFIIVGGFGAIELFTLFSDASWWTDERNFIHVRVLHMKLPAKHTQKTLKGQSLNSHTTQPNLIGTRLNQGFKSVIVCLEIVPRYGWKLSLSPPCQLCVLLLAACERKEKRSQRERQQSPFI